MVRVLVAIRLASAASSPELQGLPKTLVCASGREETKLMDLAEAQQLADDILVQERINPEIQYSTGTPVRGPIGTPPPGPAIKQSQFYYAVRSRIEGLRFRSPNFELVSIIYARLTATDKSRFIDFILGRLTSPEAFARLDLPILQTGKWNTCTSETPLIAEFLIRQGIADALIERLRAVPYTPALTQLLLQLRTIVAWDFRRLTSSQLGVLAVEASYIAQQARSTAQADREALRKQSARDPMSVPAASKNTREYVLREVPEVADVLVEQCREARFLYLRESLTVGANLEINQDKIRVSDYLDRLGFPEDLAVSLNEAESLYQEAASGFDFKSSMGHLRAFLENLHLEVCRKVHQLSGGDLPDRWGGTLEFLQNHGLLTKQEKLFVIPFYTLLSDEGVHPLQTRREYARLLRNICIEYGLLLLTKLDTWLNQRTGPEVHPS